MSCFLWNWLRNYICLSSLCVSPLIWPTSIHQPTTRKRLGDRKRSHLMKFLCELSESNKLCPLFMPFSFNFDQRDVRTEWWNLLLGKLHFLFIKKDIFYLEILKLKRASLVEKILVNFWRKNEFENFCQTFLIRFGGYPSSNSNWKIFRSFCHNFLLFKTILNNKFFFFFTFFL